MADSKIAETENDEEREQIVGAAYILFWLCSLTPQINALEEDTA